MQPLKDVYLRNQLVGLVGCKRLKMMVRDCANPRTQKILEYIHERGSFRG
jgi:hypothetical protein